MGRPTENRLKLTHKSKKLVETEQKVESKLAKTNSNGHIECIICKVTVKSAALWKVHVNSKLHKEKILIVKQIKSTIKDGITDPSQKNTTKVATKVDEKRNESSAKSMKVKELPTKTTYTVKPTATATPTAAATATASAISPQSVSENLSAANKANTLLPEKFFDDPIKDAKIRNTEYKDPQADEWERFQREIREASSVSVAIIAGEQIESAFDRDIDEINDQMKHWSRYMNLEARKGVLRGAKDQHSETQNSDDDESDDETAETTTEFSDWRSKSFI